MRPLEGIRVIEIDNWMAAPSSAAILSDLGADVIKVEPLGGDPMRGMGRPAKVEGNFEGYDFQFDVDNRGKRSIAIDLTTEAGAKVVHRLCEDAQVFLCNLLPERQARFGLDPGTLAATNNQLVHATITGYGTEGPHAKRPGYDVTAFFARSGLYDAMRESDDGLVPMARTAQGDHTTGLALSTAILAALRVVEKTGEGQVVETSLFETAVWTQASDYSIAAVDKAPLRKRSRTQQIIATANRYPCGDGKWVVFSMPDQRIWPQFCKALGLERLLEDETLQSTRDRFHRMEELVGIIDEALSAKSRDEWGTIFDEHKLIWGPVLSIDEVVADDQAAAIGLFPDLEHPKHGTYQTVSIPMRFATAEVGPKGPAPTVGQHTDEVLGDAGFSGDEIAALRSEEAIGG